MAVLAPLRRLQRARHNAGGCAGGARPRHQRGPAGLRPLLVGPHLRAMAAAEIIKGAKEQRGEREREGRILR